MSVVALNNYENDDIIITTNMVTNMFANKDNIIPANDILPITTEENLALSAANSLLLQLEQLKQLQPETGSLSELQQQLVRQIQEFEQNLKLKGLPAMLILIYRYLLCTVLDEAVLVSSWSRINAWGQHSLLTIFHQDNQGGEKFFSILEKMLQAPQRNIEVIEFIYICLSLGFSGKYKLQPDGMQKLETLRQQLYTVIRQCRNRKPLPLFANYVKPTPQQQHKWSWLTNVLLTILILLLIFAGLRFHLLQQASSSINYLNSNTAALINP